MPLSRIRLSNAHAQRQLAIKFGVGQVQISTPVQGIHQLLSCVISRLKPEANQVQRRGRCDLEPFIPAHPIREVLREPHVLANMKLQSLNSVIPQHEPQLQRSKPSSQWNLPVAI